MAECGVGGPILGTIHASKGREANLVRLMLPQSVAGGHADIDLDEESRVLYVGATRARSRLEVGRGFRPGAQVVAGSFRIFRRLRGKGTRAQVQFGMPADLDGTAHVEWSTAKDVQELLARLGGQTRELVAVASAECDWRHRLFIEYAGKVQAIGQLGDSVKRDLWSIARALGENLRPPPKINHLFLTGVTTMAVHEDAGAHLREPYSRSGLFLAPVVKGFCTLPFFRYRRGRR